MHPSEHQTPLAVAPLPLLFSGVLLILGAVLLSTWLSLNAPWLGLSVSAIENEGLRVESLHPQSPLIDVLQPEMVLKALIHRGERLPLDLPLLSDIGPHVFPRFEQYNQFLQAQDRLYRALATDIFILELDDGQHILARSAPSRPLDSLPAAFWLVQLSGAIACIIGLFVWAFRPTEIAARMLALSGASFFIATWQHSIWLASELAMPMSVYDLLLRGNHLALHIMLGALLALLACYPRPLGRNRWPLKLLFFTIIVVQLNENLQWWDLPLHSFYLPLPVYYLAGIILALVQWHIAYNSPLDRAALRWVFLSILLSMGISLTLFFIPILFATKPLVNISGMVALATTLYLGFALGVLRYRLFELERWWFNAWIWFFGGISVVVIDASLAYLFGMNPIHALGVAVIIVGWIYFPLRQWLWSQLAASSEAQMEGHLPTFVQTLFTTPQQETPLIWQELLKKVFQPLGIETHHGAVEAPQLMDNGARMVAPSLTGEPSLTLIYARHGQRLFSSRDLSIAKALHAVARRIQNVRDAEQSGARQERQRIARDLHDDVGGRLLTLIHSTSTQQQADAARQALQALRESINALDETQNYYLNDLFDDWYTELRNRLKPLNVHFVAQINATEDDALLSARQYINLRRIMDESVTNVLKHARPSTLEISCQGLADPPGLRISICNNGLSDTKAEGLPSTHSGRGMGNMHTRASELGGSVSCEESNRQGERWFCLHLRIPLVHPPHGSPRMGGIRE